MPPCLPVVVSFFPISCYNEIWSPWKCWRYHPTFAEFRAAVEDALDRVSTAHAEKLASLMTLNFQEFDDVSFLAA